MGPIRGDWANLKSSQRFRRTSPKSSRPPRPASMSATASPCDRLSGPDHGKGPELTCRSGPQSIIPQVAAAIDFATMRLISLSADGDHVAALLTARTPGGDEIWIAEHWT